MDGMKFKGVVMDFKEYIVPAISAGVYLITLMVKPLIKSDHRKFIPLGCGIVGVALNSWANMDFSFAIFLGGLASGLGATGIDQLIKQTTGYYDEVEG